MKKKQFVHTVNLNLQNTKMKNQIILLILIFYNIPRNNALAPSALAGVVASAGQISNSIKVSNLYPTEWLFANI